MHHLDTAACLPFPADLEVLSDVLASLTSELEGIRTGLEGVTDDHATQAEFAYYAGEADAPLSVPDEVFRALFSFACYLERSAEDLRETSDSITGLLETVVAQGDEERWRRPGEYDMHRARLHEWFTQRQLLYRPKAGDDA
jgi:hypothetical protein